MRIQWQKVTQVMALLVMGGLIFQTLPGWAGFNPRNRRARRPGNRQPGGTRFPCKTDSELELTALVPANNRALTVSPYPTLHWYMPTGNTHPKALFALYKVKNIEEVKAGKPIDQQEIYSTQFYINQQSGIASLKLPSESTLPPLEIGQEYRWQVKLLCLDQEDEYGVNQSVDGWITRVAPSDALNEKLQEATPIARIDLFAEDGLWNNALTELTTLRRAQPNDDELKQEWKTLFSSEYVQLSHIPLPLIGQSEDAGTE